MTPLNPATKILNKAYCRHLLKRAFDLKNTTGSSAPASPSLTSSNSPAAFRVPAANLKPAITHNAGPSISAAPTAARVAPRPGPAAPFRSSRAPMPEQFQAVQNSRAVRGNQPLPAGRDRYGRTHSELQAAGMGALWDYGPKQLAGPALNTLSGISTAGVGAANAAAGTVGMTLGGIPYLGAAATDATGLTKNWRNAVGHYVMRPMARAIDAGVKDVGGGIADTATLGLYDYDNTFGQSNNAGTQVQQLRDDLRTELGRGTDLDKAFVVTNAVGDLAAEQVAFGGFGRGLNVGAKALRGSQTAAPALRTLAALPVVGKPAARVGNWFAGAAPKSNMFRQTLPEYYAGGVGAIDDVVNLYTSAKEVGKELASSRPVIAESQLAAADQAAELARYEDTATRHAQRGVSSTHAATNAMMQDPAMINRMQHGNVPFDAATQIADEQPLGKTPEEAMQNAIAMTANDPQTQATAEFARAKQELLQPNFNAAVVQNYSTRLADLQKNNASPEEINSTIDEFVQYASQNNSPEEYAVLKQETDVLRTQLAAKPVEEKQQLAAAVQNPTGPEAQALVAQKEQEVGQQAVDAAANNPDTPPPADPAGYGQFINDTWTQAVTTFREMDPMMQLGMSLGVGTGLLGLLSSLGGGGIGTFLLGALGLGAAGFMGANSGMFGQNAQNFADDIKYNIGSALGMIPEVNKAELAPLLNADPIAELRKQSPQIDQIAAGYNPERYAREEIGPQIQKAETQLAKLNELVQQTPYMLTRATPGLSLAEAQTVIQNAKTVLADAQNPQGQLGAQLALARAFLADPVAVRNQELQKTLQPYGEQIGQGVQNLRDWGASLLTPRVTPREKPGADMNIAQHILMEQLITKAARCWAGYEPVPGKKPYSNNSCRPVGGKKKKKKPATK